MYPLFTLYTTGWVICATFFLITLLSKPSDDLEFKLVKFGLWVPLSYSFFTACASMINGASIFVFPIFFFSFLLGALVWSYSQTSDWNRNYLYGYMVFLTNLFLVFLNLAYRGIGISG